MLLDSLEVLESAALLWPEYFACHTNGMQNYKFCLFPW